MDGAFGGAAPRARRVVAGLVVLAAIVAGMPQRSSAGVVPVTVECPAGATPAARWVNFVYNHDQGTCPTADQLRYGLTKTTGEPTRYSYARTRIRARAGTSFWVANGFQMIFLAAPDAATLAEWTTKLSQGQRYDLFEARMLGSNRFWAMNHEDPHQFVAGIYEFALDRDPGTDAEYDYWIGKMATRTRGTIALSILRSLEATRKVADAYGYSAVLHRSPANQAVLDAWAKRLQHDLDQLDLVARFEATAEAFEKIGTDPGYPGI